MDIRSFFSARATTTSTAPATKSKSKKDSAKTRQNTPRKGVVPVRARIGTSQSVAKTGAGEPTPATPPRRRKRADRTNDTPRTPASPAPTVDSVRRRSPRKGALPTAPEYVATVDLPVPATPSPTKSKGKSEAMVASEDGPGEETPGGLSDYEKARLENIRINQARLAELGLADGPLLGPKEAPPAAAPKRKPKRTQEPKVPVEAERRSKRTRGEKPDYTGEKIDMFGDELDVQAGRAERAPKATRTAEEIVGEARELILKSRAALAAVAPPPNMAIAEKDGWFEQAVAIWGPRVADAKPSSWEVYVQSRLSHPPPPESPYLLMQEFFATDTWKLLISCVLMSRVSSLDVKTRSIGSFFQHYPTPSAAIEANPADVLKLISGLGLFENRWRSVVAITQRFLEMPEFTVGLDKENKIYGVGEFGVDSYLIFTRHPSGCHLTPNDKNLRAYCSWLKSLDTADANPVVKTEPV
eukprot:m.190679 g.190679  ORF g.190679 m.190679 type:complete len:470 (+) comp18084_c0_seq1:65-1474(+)